MEFKEIYLRVAKKLNTDPPSPEKFDYLWKQDSPYLDGVTVEQYEEILEKQMVKWLKHVNAPLTRKDHDEILIRFGKLTDSVPTKEILDRAWKALQELPPLSLIEFEKRFEKAWWEVVEPIVHKQVQEGTAPQWFIDSIPPGHFPVKNKPGLLGDLN